MRSSFLFLTIIVIAVITGYVSGSGDPLSSLWSITLRALPLVPLGLAAAIIISCGDIDLSPAGMFAFLGMLTLGLSNSGLPIWLVSVCVLIAAISIGVFQGWAIAYRGLAPLITTLGMSLALFGAATTIQVTLHESARGSHIERQIVEQDTPVDASQLHPERVKETPIVQTLPKDLQPTIWKRSLPWVAILLILGTLWRHRSMSALRHLAVGFDRNAAKLANLDVRIIRFRAFIVASILIYISTMLYMIDYQGGGWSAATGQGLELLAIAAAVIGGTTITGGRLDIIGVALGIGVWAALGHLCIMVPFLDPEHQKLAGGLLLLIVAFVDSKRQRL